MPSGKRRKEGMRERNDSLVVVKADGGQVEADDVYQEFGELHSDKDSVTIDVQHKIPVLHPTILGRPPIQKRTLYYVDEEPQDAGFDPFYVHGKLKSAYGLSYTGDTVEAEAERKHKRLMDMLFTCVGGFLLVFALFIGPMMGFELQTGPDEGPAVAPTEAAPPAEGNN